MAMVLEVLEWEEREVHDAQARAEGVVERRCEAGVAEARASERESARALERWEAYNKFIQNPGDKCPTCWLLKRHCCCAGMPVGIQLRPRVVVAMHYSELSRHLGSNTAKVLLSFGAELLAWGVDDQRLRDIVSEDPEGTAVLFPTPGAITAQELAAARGGSSPAASDLPRCIIVLDGGWRECARMNRSIDAGVTRCVVTTAARSDFGGTRKYGGAGDDEKRVQTAAAFVALLRELGEDARHVDAVSAGLRHFMACWEAQINRSKTWVH